MIRLLVSIRGVDELDAAIEGGADLIDLKEPLHGSLGASDPATWPAVLRAVAGRLPTSVAVGELEDPATLSRAAMTSGFDYAKVGLANMMPHANWRQRWESAVRQMPSSVQPVVVVYADHAACGCPTPREVVAAGRELSSKVLLIDTFHKQGQSVVDYLADTSLNAAIELARELSMFIVVGGSLTSESISQLRSWKPDFVAVRGAVCEQSRSGNVNRELVRALANRLAALDSAD